MSAAAVLLAAGGAGLAAYSVKKKRDDRKRAQAQAFAQAQAQAQAEQADGGGQEWWQTWGQGNGATSSGPAWLPVLLGLGQVLGSQQGATIMNSTGGSNGAGGWLSRLFGGGTTQNTAKGAPGPATAPRTAPRTGSGGLGGLFDLIGRAEAPQGFDQVWSGTRLAPPRPITSMSVQEVLNWQRASVNAGSESSAAGKFQIIRPTLQGLVDRGAISPNARFDPATQERAAESLLNGRGLQDFKAGRIDENQFAQNLSQEWAGLPASVIDRRGRPATGQSYYAGDGLNRSTVDLNSVLNAVRGL
jgi:type II secretory pathway pseudopilin PulG